MNNDVYPHEMQRPPSKATRTRGRPPRFTEAVHNYALRVPAPLWDQLRELAAESEAPANDLIVLALERLVTGPRRMTAEQVRTALERSRTTTS